MKTRRRYDFTGCLIFAFYTLAILFIIWVLASWANVIRHNTTDCEYWVFNFFRIFMKGE